MSQTKEEVLKQALINAYNAGYSDAQVNRVNDAETFVNDLLYSPRVQTFMYDGEIMTRYERMKNDPNYTDPPYNRAPHIKFKDEWGNTDWRDTGEMGG
jgi:hypothetical protein